MTLFSPARCGLTADLAQKIFPAAPFANLERYLPDIVTAAEAAGADRVLLLVSLATIRAETESFVPASELPSVSNTAPGGRSFALYDHRKDLGNQGPPDGCSYRGRGYVQLTGRFNYGHFGPLVDLDLISSPDLAALSFPAARLLFAFLAAKREKLQDCVAAGDICAAHQLVNGGAHGLARFQDSFHIGDSILPKA